MDGKPLLPSFDDAAMTMSQSPTDAVTVAPVTTSVSVVVLVPLAIDVIVAAI
jgi:hypothetical protein